MINETASQCWERLAADKRPLMIRAERYAALTIPKICLPDGFTPESTDQAHDFQSIGAQAVNHVTNKLVLAMFAPSRPFFKAQLDKKTKARMAEKGIDEVTVSPILAKIERDAIAELDGRAQRPRIYTTIRHLVVTGNVLLCLEDDELRVMGLRYYCIKRTARGKLHTAVIREKVKFDELEAEVQDACAGRHQPDSEVEHFRLLKRDRNGDITMTQWVNQNQLPKKFNGKWPEKDCPYRFLTWDLADESNYGTGLVEEYVGDFESLSALSEGVVDGAILGMEFRWLVDPTGITSAADLNKSKNGDALPGKPEDIAPAQGGNPAAVAQAREALKDFERRVSRGFLLNSAVTRDAERVTAEEIRITAMELETSFGGVYSTLAANIQKPVALWLLSAIDLDIEGTGVTVTIITGLDALSRNGDLENLRLALQDLGQVAMLPTQLLRMIDMKKIAGFIGQGRGVDLLSFLLSQDQMKAQEDSDAQSRVAEESATAAGTEQAKAAAQQGTV